jgi:hypothetical protein
MEIDFPKPETKKSVRISSPDFVNPVDNGGRELSRLLGYLLTDGYISQRKNSIWSIGILNKNAPILNDFKRLMRKIFKIQNFKRKKAPDGTPEIYINNKKVCITLLRLINSARTRACDSWPVCPKMKGKPYGSCLICKPIKIEKKIFSSFHISRFYIQE